ncbi:MAG: serine/threonine protein kinase, partial [Nannocystaceae bacterium]|nr:serine/threonine protein kinase [Nannocystaceae bacterium]
MFTQAECEIRPGAKVGPYHVLERLAVGGMAELFLARAIGPAGVERIVALKQILPGLASEPEFVEMFLNEARLASMLFHPNIVQTLEVGSAGGAHFIAMEYVHGRSLSKILSAAATRKRLPLDCAVYLVEAVASAVHYAHQQTDARGKRLGIVHRDISPSNVMVRDDGIVKLADFGIAKAVAQSPKTQA